MVDNNITIEVYRTESEAIHNDPYFKRVLNSDQIANALKIFHYHYFQPHYAVRLFIDDTEGYTMACLTESDSLSDVFVKNQTDVEKELKETKRKLYITESYLQDEIEQKEKQNKHITELYNNNRRQYIHIKELEKQIRDLKREIEYKSV